MAVLDNADGSSLSSRRELDAGVLKEDHKDHFDASRIPGTVLRPHHDSSFSEFQIKVFKPPATQQFSGKAEATATAPQLPNGRGRGNGEAGFKQDMRDLEELLSKLNPMAEEFVPPSQANYGSSGFGGVIGSFFSTNFGLHGMYPNVSFPNSGYQNGVNANASRRGKTGHSHGNRRMNTRTSMAQREEIIRRTVYVSDIDQQVTEEELAALFVNCGQVIDCRVCGDPKSVLHFAFVEFTDEEGAKASLSLSGTMLGFYPVRVLPSKTAIAPVDPRYLPRSEDEREMCTRTIYCTNIDNKVTQAEVKLFFETICGPVYRLRLLGDFHNATRIAFVEFARAESAIAALNCSGAILGSFPLRVSPSKTPVRPRPTRASMPSI
ncbi:Polyadenylate-binding protein 2 [Platanthera guangdongensis]|uniref:Polyadenylate-binding protein 2 n=1 Tax=Platanthera guangdongensis TaxID=2320717 RepID=A0ABR2MNS7_9ASPA